MKRTRKDVVSKRSNQEPIQESPAFSFRREVIDTSPIVGKTRAQERYIQAIKGFTLVFGLGPAGVGKTYLATAMAAQAFKEGDIDKIILTRPAVEVGEKLGHLPGELDEKFDPYLRPFKEVFYRRLGKSQTEYAFKAGQIEAIPLGFMRGCTFRNAMVILDEAQNTTPEQMKMFLTRIGENCTVVINGDIGQSDIRGLNGLEDGLNTVSFIPSVKVVEFHKEDVVRSGLVQEIVEAYEAKKKGS